MEVMREVWAEAQEDLAAAEEVAEVAEAAEEDTLAAEVNTSILFDLRCNF